MTPVPRRLSEAELFDWLRLARSEGVGPNTFLRLVGRFGSARAALEALPSLPRGGRALKAASPASVEAELLQARRAGLLLLPLCDPAFPPALRAIPAAPPLIVVRGRPEVLLRPAVAIVGSRNASATGLILTDRFAADLGRAGFVVVSGLARGIDARAHAASLLTGTVAVLAGGHARIYPGEHRSLADRIAETGAVVSEMPPDWEPRGRDFPRRNRIVSGLALGTVVMEAARRSGSLITARFAAEQGRDVFAVPGSPLDPRHEGTNDLIRGGATLCNGAADVIDDLRPSIGSPPASLRNQGSGAEEEDRFWDEADDGGDPDGDVSAPTTQDERDGGAASDPAARLLALLGAAPIGIDDLARAAGLPVSRVQALVVELELAGDAARQDSGVTRRPA